MKLTNHPFRKENDLPNLHEDMFQPLIFRRVQFLPPTLSPKPSQEVHLKPPRARARPRGKRKPDVSPEKENSQVPRTERFDSHFQFDAHFVQIGVGDKPTTQSLRFETPNVKRYNDWTPQKLTYFSTTLHLSFRIVSGRRQGQCD